MSQTRIYYQEFLIKKKNKKKKELNAIFYILVSGAGVAQLDITIVIASGDQQIRANKIHTHTHINTRRQSQAHITQHDHGHTQDHTNGEMYMPT